MIKDARFYFANLCVDIGRCAAALQKEDTARYETHLAEAYKTLRFLRDTHNAAAYEEGQLLIRSLEYARTNRTLRSFGSSIDELTSEYAPAFQ